MRAEGHALQKVGLAGAPARPEVSHPIAGEGMGVVLRRNWQVGLSNQLVGRETLSHHLTPELQLTQLTAESRLSTSFA